MRKDHPLRTIRELVNEAALANMQSEFAGPYAGIGRPSVDRRDRNAVFNSRAIFLRRCHKLAALTRIRFGTARIVERACAYISGYWKS